MMFSNGGNIVLKLFLRYSLWAHQLDKRHLHRTSQSSLHWIQATFFYVLSTNGARWQYPVALLLLFWSPSPMFHTRGFWRITPTPSPKGREDLVHWQGGRHWISWVLWWWYNTEQFSSAKNYIGSLCWYPCGLDGIFTQHFSDRKREAMSLHPKSQTPTWFRSH